MELSYFKKKASKTTIFKKILKCLALIFLDINNASEQSSGLKLTNYFNLLIFFTSSMTIFDVVETLVTSVGG